MNELKLSVVFIPQTIHQAIRARGVQLEGFAKGARAEHEKLSILERAQLQGCQRFEPFKRAVGTTGFLPVQYGDYKEEELRPLVYDVNNMADTEGVQLQLQSQFAGNSDNDKCIEVIDLAPGFVGIVFGPGSVDALRKDNNVLTLLQSVMHKFLVYGSLDQIMGTMVAGIAERLVAVSAFANPTARPPVPVYR